MTLPADLATGADLAEQLLRDVGNEQMRAATRLLGAHREGYWLRRFTASSGMLDTEGATPSIDWTAVGLGLIDGDLQGSFSELAVLRFAVSLVGRAPVDLKTVLGSVDAGQARLLVRALREAANLA